MCVNRYRCREQSEVPPLAPVPRPRRHVKGATMLCLDERVAGHGVTHLNAHGMFFFSFLKKRRSAISFPLEVTPPPNLLYSPE